MVILKPKCRDLYNCEKKALGMILASGEGSRLHPATRKARCAFWRQLLTDWFFPLNNFINLRIYSIYVLTQLKSQSLAEHLQGNWRFSSILREHFILPVPLKKTGARWDVIWNRIKKKFLHR
jgi:glucose-1-phosphate adenylyltransferase